MSVEIINFEKNYEKETLKLFYRSVFYNRKEFEYARLPAWSHRYLLEDVSIQRLATINGKIVGSLGLIVYTGYINDKKQNIGFFVDNCILPEYTSKYDSIMSQLFQNVEHVAKTMKVNYILGWDYTRKVDSHNDFFCKMGYSHLDGINWFGGGTKPVLAFFEKRENISFIWRLALGLLNLKFQFRERRTRSLTKETIRPLKNTDISIAADLINRQNKLLTFSPKYSKDTLKKAMEKYHAKGWIVETKDAAIGVLITFLAPWSGWMYGRPEYTSKFTNFLINHPLEFAVDPEYAKQVAPHLLFTAMKSDINRRGYFMLVDVFDRRISWMTNAFFDIGADELPYDFGTLLFKSFAEDSIELSHPVYVPTNLVISPYTGKYL